MSAEALKKYWSKEYLDRIMKSSFFWDQASLIQARPRYETKGRVEILKELFKSGITLGISSRGMGTTRESEGKTLVNDDFELVAFDFVSNPSTRGAFLEPVNLNESVSYDKKIVTSGRVCTQYCKVEGLVHEILGEIGEM